MRRGEPASPAPALPVLMGKSIIFNNVADYFVMAVLARLLAERADLVEQPRREESLHPLRKGMDLSLVWWLVPSEEAFVFRENLFNTRKIF